ncbi:MAG: hypothetical protein IBJ18_08975 [Phycisphaerales bacterium]|nr:hypothetical protein [Phycisphaerales bacterium]
MTPKRRSQNSPGVPRSSAAILLLTSSIIAPGCVTERIEPAGRISPYIATGVDPSKPRAFVKPTTSNTHAEPVATAPRLTTQTLGDFRTDGLSLPLISPDGKYIAFRLGSPPVDELRLAPAPLPGAAVPRIVTIAQDDPSRIVIEQLDRAQQPIQIPATQPIEPDMQPAGDEPIPHGVLLGRSCTDEGFLIEWPRPDGSRWIGFVRWTTARVTWLVRSDQHVPWLAASNAVLSARGDLFFAYRTDPAQGWSLARRTRDGTFQELDSTHEPIRWPVLSFSGLELAQCVVRKNRVRIERVAIPPVPTPPIADGDQPGNNPPAHDAQTASSLDLGPAEHTLELYNATLPQQPALMRSAVSSDRPLDGSFETLSPPPQTLISEWNEGFSVLESGRPAISMWNSRLNRVLRLPPGVQAVHVHEKGLFFTSNTGLSYVGHTFSDSRWLPSPPVIVNSSPSLIRSSSVRESWTIHPMRGSDGVIRVESVNLGDLSNTR